MHELTEKSLLDLLNVAEGKWKSMPFPGDKVPEGHKAEAIQGEVDGVLFLAAKATLPGDNIVYDGTATMPPLTFIHVTPAVAEAAFLKGSAWLEKQKAGQ
jgi:hypothetical protein